MIGRDPTLLKRKSSPLPLTTYGAAVLPKVSELRTKGLPRFWVSAVKPAGPTGPKMRAVSWLPRGSAGLEVQLEATFHRPLELPVQVCPRAGGVAHKLKIATSSAHASEAR